MTLKSFVFLACLLASPLPAAAQDVLIALRAEAVVAGDVVRLGDIVTGAGEKASIPLFRAPELGKIGSIRAESIRAAAAELGFNDIETGGLSLVNVTRKNPNWGVEQLIGHLRDMLARQDASLADGDVVFDNVPPPIDGLGDIANAVHMQFFDRDNGRFRVVVSQNAIADVVLTGVIRLQAPVPVLIRSIGRGDVVTPADFVMEKRPRQSLPAGVITDPAKLGSMVARRPIKPGLIRADDLTGRDLVERNQKVTVTYHQPGLSLTMAGKALGAGAHGAVVQVQNLASKRSFDAIVTGPAAVSAKIY